MGFFLNLVVQILQIQSDQVHKHNIPLMLRVEHCDASGHCLLQNHVIKGLAFCCSLLRTSNGIEFPSNTNHVIRPNWHHPERWLHSKI